MQRPPIACRRAVQSLHPPAPQHIWVSDELLSNTFHRFFRGTCPHQKRHGSHVPGPLEARRRAAKRRMTVSANFYPQDSFPSSFNLGALFGFGSTPQPSWRYEPPSQQEGAEPLDIQTNTASAPDLHSAVPVRTYLASSKPSLRSAAYSFSPNIAHSIVKEPKNPEPKACFKAFRTRIAVADELAQELRDKVISQAFQECCPTSDIWSYNILVIRHLCQVGWDPKAILKQHSTLNFVVPPIYSSKTLDFLICLETLMSRHPHCIQDIHQLHVRLAESARYAQTSCTSYQNRILFMLLRQLWHTAHSQSPEQEESVLDVVSWVADKLSDRVIRRSLRSVANNIADAEQRIALLVGHACRDAVSISAVADVLSCIPKERLSKLIPAITLGRANKAARNNPTMRASGQGQMHVWLQILHQLDSISALPDGSFVNAAIIPLANHTFAHRDELHARIPILLSALLVKASQTAAFACVPKSKISNLLESFDTAIIESSPIPIDATLGVLMSRVQAEGLPHEPLVGMIVDVFVRYAGLKATPEFLQVLYRRRLTLVDATPVHELVAKRVAAIRSSNSNTLSEKACQHIAFDLQACEKILEVLSRANTPMSEVLQLEVRTLQAQRQFQHILARAQTNHVLPLTYRNVTSSTSTEETVNMIHQFAHQYTTANTISQRQAWRAMYYLYKYLKQHSLPMGPLFSKAVVRVSIIRPMSENRFVSARRLIWVCQLVARVEGEEVAKKVEKSFWHWRGDLIEHAKSMYISVGGERGNKAHIGTMKKLGLI